MKHITDDTSFLSGRQRIGAHALCVQHSSTAAAISTSFLLNHAPQQPWAERIDYKESYSSVSMSQKDWRNQAATGWILAMHWYSIWVKKCNFRVSSFLPGSAEAHYLRRHSKAFLIAHFIGNISAKKYQSAFTCVKVIANQRWDVFGTQCTCMPYD